MEASPNKAAEKKYSNIRPWLLCRLGQEDQGIGLSRSSRVSSRSSKRCRKKGHADVEFKSIPGVCFLPKSQKLVTSEFASPTVSACRIQIFDAKGRLTHSFPTEFSSNLFTPTFGISPANDEEEIIAVCLGDGIGIWNVEGKLISKMTDRDVENCSHATNMKNGLLATTCITSMKGKCVTLWDPRAGKAVAQFGSRSEIIDKNPLKSTHRVIIRNDDIQLPWFLTANSQDEIFISDRNARCVKVFDTRKQAFLRNFDIHGINTRCKKTLYPQGLCADENDNILVADSHEKCLYLFDRYGEFVTTLGSAIDQTIMGEPWAIAITTEPQFPLPIMRSRLPGKDNARLLAISIAAPDPNVAMYKLSLCPHYTQFT